MFDRLLDSAGLLAIGVGLGFALDWIIRMVPGWVDDFAGKYLDQLLDIDNPADRELVLAMVKWAEFKIPDRGQGREKYRLVGAKIVKLFPIMAKHEDRIARLIEAAVSQMDDELKERLKKKEE